MPTLRQNIQTPMVDELNGIAENETPPPLRIFLAAPPDVSEERAIVEGLIHEFEHNNVLKLVTWSDDQALSERRMPAGCDLAVFLLWSRMDAALLSKTHTDEERIERSSLQMAYANAAALAMDRGRPDIWVYQRTQAPSVRLDAPDIDERLAQWRKVYSFVSFLREDSRLPACNLFTYDTLSKFRFDFTQRIRHWVANRLDRRCAVAMEAQASKPSPVQFTAYHPKEVVPYKAYDLLRGDTIIDGLIFKLSDGTYGTLSACMGLCRRCCPPAPGL